MMTKEVLLAKAAFIEKDRLPAIEHDAAAIEELAKRIEGRDHYLAEHIRRFTSRSQIEMTVGRVRHFVHSGSLAQAEQAATNWENHFNFIRDLLIAPNRTAARTRAAIVGGGSKGGRAEKRRKWAETLAQHLARVTTNKEQAWNTIPDPADLLELESYGDDLQVYRDGENVVCIENGKHRKLSRSTFLKRYFPPPEQ